jgi:hypothetical protein
VPDAKDQQIAAMRTKLDELNTVDAKRMDMLVRQTNDCLQFTKKD